MMAPGSRSPRSLACLALLAHAACSADTRSAVPGADAGAPPADAAPLELCINELMPDNEAALADETGARPDWIELHNPGAADVDLGGWSLTDDPAVPGKSVLPDGMVIAAGGFLLLFADDRAVMSPTHLGFKLGSGGEVVGLFAPDGRGSLITYGAISADFSAARRPDCCSKDGCFHFDFRGSPGASNVERTLETVEVLPRGSVYRYFDQGSVPAADWMAPGFDDSAWASGAAPLGYGDPHIATTVSFGPDPANKHMATWFRARFEVTGREALMTARLMLLRDDGARVFINGVEAARSNLPAGPLDAATPASVGVGGAEETSYLGFVLDPALLVEGENVLAIETHQAAATSSDLGMDVSISASRLVP